MRISPTTHKISLGWSRLSKLEDSDGGIASIYRTVQGLAADVGDFEQKRNVLAQIFEANLVLQKNAS